MTSESSVNPERLWRIINFFELISIIRTGSIRVSRADQFSDLNEFIANALGVNHLGRLLPTAGSGVDVKKWKDNLRTSIFTSCWSKVQAHPKMWEVYSGNHEGVQIECRLDSLSRGFKKFFPEIENVTRHHTPANEGVIFWSPIDEGDCVYVDREGYELEIWKIAERYEQESKISLNEDLSFRETFEKHSVAAENLQRVSLRVKDESYSFENEYRFSWVARTRNDLEYTQALAQPLFPLADDHLRNTRSEETEPQTFFPFDVDLIDVVYLDGRLSSWKLDECYYILKAIAPDLTVKIANF